MGFRRGLLMNEDGMDFLLEDNMPEHYEPDWEPTEDY